MLAFIRGLVRDADVAEDIFQETWLRLAAAIESGQEIQDASSWSRGVARNLILHHWRDRQRERVVMDSDLLGLVEQAYVEQSETVDRWPERSEALQRCVERLPQVSRRIIDLKYAQGWPVKRIAEELPQTVTNVMKILSRARTMLAACVDQATKPQNRMSEGSL